MSYILEALGKAEQKRRADDDIPELSSALYEGKHLEVRPFWQTLLAWLGGFLIAFTLGALARPAIDRLFADAPTQAQSVLVNAAQTAPDQTPKEAPSVATKPADNPAPDGLSRFKLSVISWSDKPSKRFGMINNGVIHEGDVLPGDYKVVKIEKNHLRLRKAGETFHLWLQ